jgi:WD40 repeat protein
VYSSDGTRVLSASEDQTLRLWDVATARCLYCIRGAARFTGVAVTARQIAAGDALGNGWMLDCDLLTTT